MLRIAQPNDDLALHVVYPGPRRCAIADRIEALPLDALLPG